MSVFSFWFVSLLVGALAVPIAFRVLRRMPDGGAGLAFPLGLTLCGYAYFVLRSASILPQGRGGYLAVIALLAIAGVTCARTDRRFSATARRSMPALVTIAGLFTLLFFSYVAFRSYTPEIAGTEQPMDLMYLNATMTSPDYPPEDSWLAGERASYYYFGYLQVGLLSSAAGVPASTGYNLALAYVFAASGVAAVSLALALARRALGSSARRFALAAGAIALVLLLAVGSLSAIFEWSAAHGHYDRGLYETFGVQWMIPCSEGETDDCYAGAVSPRTAEWYPTEFWFWWRGSRIIPNTITEFPFFSFLLGDLHPHVMSIPLVLLALGLALATWSGRSSLSFAEHRRRPAKGLLLATLFGALAFTNAWDVLTFSGVLAVAVAARNLRALRPLPALRATAGYIAPVFAVAIALYLPWYVTFSSQADGIHAYAGAGTLPAHAFLQFGILVAFAVLALTWAFRDASRRAMTDALVNASWAPLLPMLGWLALATYDGNLSEAVNARTGAGWITLGAYAAITWLLAAGFIFQCLARRTAAPALGCAALGLLLLYGTELFYVGDIFAESLPRQNTVFKLSYQAWLLLSVSGAAIIAVTLREAVSRRAALGWLAVPALALGAAGLVYPLLAMPNRTDGFDPENGGNDGLAFVARSNPAQYALTRWLQENASPGDVVIEASGRQYGRNADGQPVVVGGPPIDYGEGSLLSARTGLPTVIGWYFHELQWRGVGEKNTARFSARQDLADSVYLARDPAVALAAIREAGARYVVVGQIELDRFPGLLANFDTFLDVAFESDDLRIYEVPSYVVVETS